MRKIIKDGELIEGNFGKVFQNDIYYKKKRGKEVLKRQIIKKGERYRKAYIIDIYKYIFFK